MGPALGCTAGPGCVVCADPDRYATACKLRAWCGPVWVKQYADQLRAVGATDVIEGTEHVYCSFRGFGADDAAHRLGEAMREAGHGSGLIFYPL